MDVSFKAGLTVFLKGVVCIVAILQIVTVKFFIFNHSYKYDINNYQIDFDHDTCYHSRVMSLENDLTMMHIIILELCPLKMI